MSVLSYFHHFLTPKTNCIQTGMRGGCEREREREGEHDVSLQPWLDHHFNENKFIFRSRFCFGCKILRERERGLHLDDVCVCVFSVA